MNLLLVKRKNNDEICPGEVRNYNNNKLCSKNKNFKINLI